MGLISGLMGNAGIVDADELQEEYSILFFEGEQVGIGFKLVRDVFIFTNYRLILVDKQGLTGRKVEYLSIGYKSISRFSLETAGRFDFDAELKIWISGENHPSVSKKFNKKVNIYDLQQILAYYVMS